MGRAFNSCLASLSSFFLSPCPLMRMIGDEWPDMCMDPATLAYVRGCPAGRTWAGMVGWVLWQMHQGPHSSEHWFHSDMDNDTPQHEYLAQLGALDVQVAHHFEIPDRDRFELLWHVLRDLEGVYAPAGALLTALREYVHSHV